MAYGGILARPGGVQHPVFSCNDCCTVFDLKIETRGRRVDLWWLDPAAERAIDKQIEDAMMADHHLWPED